MKKTILIPLFFCVAPLFAQVQSDSQTSVLKNDILLQKQEITVLQQKLNNQQSIINQQRVQLDTLSTKAKNQEDKIDSLKLETNRNAQNIQTIAADFGTKIQQTEITTKDGISKLSKDVNQNKLYWIIATLATLLLGGLMYLFLGKRIKSSQIDVETKIKDTKKSLEEESVKLDNKLLEILETQLKLSQEEKSIGSQIISSELDHSLALKVADEIVRMQKNISRMDSSTKGLKPLEKGIERIQANFASNGYEMVNLLNKEYDERMNIDVISFIEDENIDKDKKIITRIIKPQVNYNGILIQRAQVDVLHN